MIAPCPVVAGKRDTKVFVFDLEDETFDVEQVRPVEFRAEIQMRSIMIPPATMRSTQFTAASQE